MSEHYEDGVGVRVRDDAPDRFEDGVPVAAPKTTVDETATEKAGHQATPKKEKD